MKTKDDVEMEFWQWTCDKYLWKIDGSKNQLQNPINLINIGIVSFDGQQIRQQILKTNKTLFRIRISWGFPEFQTKPWNIVVYVFILEEK